MIPSIMQLRKTLYFGTRNRHLHFQNSSLRHGRCKMSLITGQVSNPADGKAAEYQNES